MSNYSSKPGVDFDDEDLKYDKSLASPFSEGRTKSSGPSVLCMGKRDWPILAIIGVLGFFVRFFRISQPESVVFDEVHFGGFAAKYVKGNYFFDVHPPLAKLMIAGVAWVYGFDGNFDFSDIGKSFVGHNVPYVAMRSTQAFFGWLLLPTCYVTGKVIGLTTEASALGAFMILFDNGLTTQSRHILLDSPLLLFTAGATLAWLIFCNQSRRPFTKSWWGSLASTGLFLGFSLSCKWVGLFTVALIGISTVKQLWDMLGDLKISPPQFLRHFIARALCLIGIPIFIYMVSFQVQFMVLRNYTEAASSMSAEFQSSLNGNGLVEAKQDVAYGSTLRINHVATNGGYLHSHDHYYPAGSKQQQITLYPFRDANNFWIIEKGLDPNRNDTETSDIEYVKNQDIIRLRHLSTSKRLHSHNVRPMFSDKDYMNEASGYTWPDSNDNFRVDILRGDKRNPESSERLMAIYSRFRLIHVNTGCVLYSRPEKLPEWGFKQQQVFCIRDGMKPRSEWVIETNINEHLNNSPIVSYGQMGFLGKFLETNQRMWVSNSGLVASHPFDSRPQSWPFLTRGISFWGKNHAQIYLIGNPWVWYLGSISVLVFFVVQVVLSLINKRGIRAPSPTLQNRYYSEVGFFVGGWLLHYFPFFLMKRQLFLHHYLPAFYFSVMGFITTIDLLTRRLRPQFRLGVVLSIGLVTLFMFYKFSSLAYGLQWTKEDCLSAKWSSNWDFDCNSMN